MGLPNHRRHSAAGPACAGRTASSNRLPGACAAAGQPGLLSRGASTQSVFRRSSDPWPRQRGQAEDMMTVMEPTAAEPARQADGGIHRPDGSPVRVLVVDDEPSLAELLASVLRYEGWEIRTAADGGSAVRTAREFQPDAVVLDIMLPDFDGLEVLRRLRATQPGVCVLFLTARDSVEDRVKGITAGGDDYVTKPFSLEEVLARLRGLLRRAGINQARSGTELVVGD